MGAYPDAVYILYVTGPGWYGEQVRILVVTPWFPSSQNSSSGIFVRREALALAGRHDVVVLHLLPPAQYQDAQEHDPDLTVIRQPMRVGDPRHWWRALKATRRLAQGADLVHTQAISGLLPFALMRPGKNRPWAHTEHWSAIPAPETLSGLMRIVRRLVLPLLSRPDVLIVGASTLAHHIQPHRRGPIERVGCVVDPPLEPLTVRTRPPQRVRAIGVGLLNERKGPLTALRAVLLLRDAGYDASLTWVGTGPQSEAAQRLAAEHGSSEALRLTGRLDEEAVRHELDDHDVFILPTLGDNFCIVVAEAILQGIPVVSGSATGASDYASSPVALFTDSRDPATYAKAILRVLDDTAGMSAQQISDHIGNRFSGRQVAAALTDVYHRLLGGFAADET